MLRVQEADIERAAQQVTLRPHARETIKTALQRGWHVHVLSVNWSSALIRCVLAGLPCRTDTDGGDSTDLGGPAPAVAVHANSLEMQLGISTGAFPPLHTLSPHLLCLLSAGCGPPLAASAGARIRDRVAAGAIVCHMQGPVDKGTVLEDILLSIAAASGDGSAPCIYVGDSVGDLSALLVANFPIVFGDNAVLAHALSAFGCHVQALQEAPVAIADADNAALPPGHVLKASTWREIYDFLFPQAAGGRPDAGADGGGMGLGADGGASGGSAPVTPPAGAAAQDRARPTLSGGLSSIGGSPAARSAVADELPAVTPVAVPRALSQTLPRSSTTARSVVPPRVLVVAGSDSGGGAGIQADVRACMANHAFAATAITALTAQNSHGVHAVHTAPVDIIAAQIDAVIDDIGADCVKTGMMPSGEVVRAVAARLRAARGAGRSFSVVVDPVLVSTSGSALGAEDVVDALKAELFPLATLITPNLEEATKLLGAPLNSHRCGCSCAHACAPHGDDQRLPPPNIQPNTADDTFRWTAN